MLKVIFTDSSSSKNSMFFYCFFSVNIILLFGNTGFLLYFIKIYSIIEEIVYEREILKMRIFVVCLLAWFIAQLIKVIINFTKYVIDKKIVLGYRKSWCTKSIYRFPYCIFNQRFCFCQKMKMMKVTLLLKSEQV